MNRLETQRGFHSLAEYLTKYSHLPDVDPSHFPPHRATFLPSNEFLTGWRTYARRFGRGQDLTVKVGKTRRKSAQRGAAGVPRGGTAGEESGGEEE